jgi:hypothetical protein
VAKELCKQLRATKWRQHYACANWCGPARSRGGACRAITQWFQEAKTRQKISSPIVISRIFLNKFQEIQIISVSDDCICFISKICQRVAGMNMTSRFYEFLNFIFGGILLFGTTVYHSK